MTSPAPSSHTSHGSNPGRRNPKAGAIYPANTNAKNNCPCTASTNPVGFSFIGQFCVREGAADRVAEKQATQISIQASNDDTWVTVSLNGETDKTQNIAYQKAVDERREKYLPCYGNVLPFNSALQVCRVPSDGSHERCRSLLEVRTNEIGRANSENNMAGHNK